MVINNGLLKASSCSCKWQRVLRPKNQIHSSGVALGESALQINHTCEGSGNRPSHLHITTIDPRLVWRVVVSGHKSKTECMKGYTVYCTLISTHRPRAEVLVESAQRR